MNFMDDAFLDGVKPGGLKTKNDIKLLICYLLSNLKDGLSRQDVISILQENSIANYFEAIDAFADLIDNHNIYCTDKENSLYTVTKSGELISQQLEASLPVTVREQALSASLNLLAKLKRERENKVEISKITNGYSLNCHISGGDHDLMYIELYTPDLMQARFAKQNFQKNPQLVYSCMLALLTSNRQTLVEILKNLI